MTTASPGAGRLQIGWHSIDITPDYPVLIAGQFHARVSEGVADPVTATALALESGAERAVLVSCDLVAVSDELRHAVRQRLAGSLPGLDPLRVIFNATHTHTGPEIREPTLGAGHVSMGTGVELNVCPPVEYIDWAAGRLSAAITAAPGPIATTTIASISSTGPPRGCSSISSFSVAAAASSLATTAFSIAARLQPGPTNL